MFGNESKVSNQIMKKYGKLSYISYVTVPLSKNKKFNNSLEHFSKNIHVE